MIFVQTDPIFAALLLTLLGVQVPVPYGLSLDSTALAPLPTQDRMYPFGIIEVAAWYNLTRPLVKWNDSLVDRTPLHMGM